MPTCSKQAATAQQPIDSLALLDDFLSQTTPEALYAELCTYEAVGPKAIDFLADVPLSSDDDASES